MTVFFRRKSDAVLIILIDPDLSGLFPFSRSSSASFVCFSSEKLILLTGNLEKSQSFLRGAAMELVSPVLIWFLLGVVFFVAELIAPGFILFFLGIGAWCTASVLAVVKLSLTVQMIIFLISSFLTLIFLRSWLRAVFLGDSSEEDDSVNVDSAPTTGIVTEAIAPPGLGRVKYGGSFWKAAADESIAVNTVVQILERKNLIVQVRPLHSEPSAEKE
ncbi:MAG: NfeD family protein [Candidatus Electrothrix sp. EH2]|nr:NfeD family protein [Candidatus Electrothrix sp. EH2]